MRLSVDSSLPRQTPDGGPWLFWKDVPGPVGREGLLLLLTTCTNRKCECRDVMVEARIVGPELVAIEMTTETVRLTHRGTAVKDPRRVKVAISFETGEVVPLEDQLAPGPEDAAILDRIKSELDGDLLDRLYEEWLAAKGWRRPVEPVTKAWKRELGRLVAWQEVFLGEREDRYVVDGDTFAVDDLYCPKPGCDCNQVVFHILARETPKRFRDVGHVFFDSGRGEVDKIEGLDGTPSTTIERVWKALQARHDIAPRTAARHQRLREIGQTVWTAGRTKRPGIASPPRKVGRNAPCPCGSGNKYKRCCLGKDASYGA